MRDSKITMKGRLALPLAAAFAVTALGAGTAVAQDEPAYAGLDKDLSGQTIKMAAIGGGKYEVMYESIDKFEEETGATVEIVYLGDGFEIDPTYAFADDGGEMYWTERWFDKIQRANVDGTGVEDLVTGLDDIARTVDFVVS